MQRRRIIFVIAVLVLGLLTQQLWWAAKPIGTNPGATSGLALDVLQMQHDKNTKNIPAQEMDDRSLVFGGH